MAEQGPPKASDRRTLALIIGFFVLIFVGWFIYSMIGSAT